jgi:hypothetical protein
VQAPAIDVPGLRHSLTVQLGDPSGSSTSEGSTSAMSTRSSNDFSEEHLLTHESEFAPAFKANHTLLTPDTYGRKDSMWCPKLGTTSFPVSLLFSTRHLPHIFNSCSHKLHKYSMYLESKLQMVRNPETIASKLANMTSQMRASRQHHTQQSTRRSQLYRHMPNKLQFV